MAKRKDVEKIYEEANREYFAAEEISLGPWTSYSLIHDPKHMCFAISRYKFCSKMLARKKTIMEVGSGDGFGLPILAQVAEKIIAVDWDKRLLDGNARRLGHLKNVEYIHMDLNKKGEFPDIEVDAAVAIDVLEHLDPATESNFLENTIRCLKPNGVFMIGTPNKTAEKYASYWVSKQHINLKSMESLCEITERYFENVFMFGMNDEVVHTGYDPMCHFIWSVGVGVKKEWLEKFAK